MYVADMMPDGIGALTIAFEQLKQRLYQEGLFDEGHKKPIPRLAGAHCCCDVADRCRRARYFCAF